MGNEQNHLNFDQTSIPSTFSSRSITLDNLESQQNPIHTNVLQSTYNYENYVLLPYPIVLTYDIVCT